MNWKRYIPNTLTTLNLASGLISVLQVMEGELVTAAWFIFLAAVFDFLDGVAARVLDARSELGKQLDSLADLVSFGVAPGLILFRLLSIGCEGSCNVLERLHITPYFALLIPVCSAFRLAKFNIDLTQELHFSGLPTPANALFFASIPLVLFIQTNSFSLIPVDFFFSFFSNTRVLAILSVLFSYLLISDFRMFSMKFRHFRWKGNEMRLLFLILALAYLILFSVGAVPLIILTYIVLSLFFQKKIQREF
jgi:CDP-diacylglycerol--serine O-phosphatidyltransferase